jgi:hypothetical protein
MLIFSALPSKTAGGRLVGIGSFTADIGIMAVLLFLMIAVSLVPIARRLLGDLINELIRLGVADPALREFDPSGRMTPRFLHWLERLSQIEGRCGMVWFLVMLAEQAAVYWLVILRDGMSNWVSADAAPGTPLFLLASGNKQPNLAGLWALLVWGPIILYLLVVIARLLVVFSCLCSHIARNEHLTIVPAHPDGAGGLKPVGQSALFLSLFTFALGVDLAGLTLNELVLSRIFRGAAAPPTSNLRLLVALWILYLLLGSLLFFLPLLPLRSRMAAAKRTYLLEALALHAEAESKHRADVRALELKPAELQGFGALDERIRQATDMTVWPFDKGSFVRYAGLLVSPLAPVVVDQLPRMIAVLKAYLGLRP